MPSYLEILKNRKVVSRGYKTKCWEWTKAIGDHGYGVVWAKGKVLKVHRIAAKAKGLLGKIVMHKCDNRPCFRPSHLAPGTVKTNTQDAIVKRRHTVPTKHGNKTLTPEQIKRFKENLRKEG